VGDGDARRWLDVFAQQGDTLSAAGVDGFHVETMTDVREAAVALRALREVAPRLPVLVSLAFDHRRRGLFTVMGDAPAVAWRALLQAGAAAVGANCGLGSAAMRALADEARALGLRAALQPNAGQPELDGDHLRYAQEAGSFADDLAPAAADCAALGGCCGTTPAFLAALAERLRGPRRT
jgi:methionine synthase I (cobalamin-dependent)